MHISGNFRLFRKTFPRYLIIIYVLFTIGILLTGIFYYYAQKNRVLDEHTDDLIAVSTLKSGQIQSWLKERKGDANITRDNVEFIKAAELFFKSGSDYSSNSIMKWLGSIKSNFDYGNIMLLDERLKVRLTLDELDTIPGEIIEDEMQDLKRNHNIVFTDFHRSSVYNRVHSDALVPLIHENRFVGAVILRIDPSVFLFPLIQSWPTFSPSSETLIIRCESDRVVFINELRKLKNTSMSLWLPMTDTETVAIKAALGARGIVEGIDYMEKPVLGYSNPIPGTNWILITKTDKEEIYEPIDRYLVLSVIITLSLILINSSIFIFWIWNQRTNEFRRQLEASEKLVKSEERFRSVLDNMLEGCQIIGHDWTFLYVNRTADMHNRRPRTVLLGRNYLEMWPGIEKTDVFRVLKSCMEDRVAERLENRFVFPDGSVGWFELSIQPVPEGIFILSIDITEKKLAENAIRESEELLTIQKRIGDIFLTSSNDEMYFEILSLILEKLRSPLGVFGYIDREGSLVVPTMTRHVWERCKITNKTVIFPRSSWGNSSWPRAIREKRVNYSNSGSDLTPEGHMKLTRFISFPIIFHDEVIGLFQVANKESDYNSEDIELLEKISDYVAPILNSRLLNEWSKGEIVRLNNQLEHRVAERTSQLEEANRDLESFSYSVSHDLRSPLRSVSGFTKILVDEYGDRLDAEGIRLCGIITSSTAKMGELIDDLLNFSRLGRSTITPGKLNMNELVAVVYNDITNDIEKSRIRIEIKNLPEINADAGLMKVVWNNLLSNAVKYSSKSLQPAITVDSERSDGMITYSVEDNGAGFDMRYYNKLFGVFQRLHSEDEFEGNGVGLAIVHRIIKRHNGKVWAEGNPGKGAKFFISLPVS